MTTIELPAVSPALRRSGWIPSPAVDETGSDSPEHRLPGLDETEQRCWHEFLDASARVLETLNRILIDEHQLTLFDFMVLEMLARSRGSARMGDLAQELVLLPSRVSQQIRRLESDGLVERHRSTNDGRGVIATITREGLARVRPAVKTYARAVRMLYIDQMSRRQIIVLGDSCRRISVSLKAPPKRNRTE